MRAEAKMERERAELGRVVELCDKDAEILRERIATAGEVIRDAESREIPGVDTVVVAPTVVHTQYIPLFHNTRVRILIIPPIQTLRSSNRRHGD